MASIQKLLLNWNWKFCPEIPNTWLLLCFTITFTIQCFGLYEYFAHEEKRLFKNKNVFIAMQISIFVMSIVDMLILGAKDEYLYQLSNDLILVVGIAVNSFLNYSYSHLITVESYLKRTREVGTAVFAILIIILSSLVIVLSTIPSNRFDRIEVYALFCLFFGFFFFSFYFPAKQIRMSKDKDDSTLMSACLYYLIIVMLYFSIGLLFLGLSKFGDSGVCEKGLYVRLSSPLTAIFVYTGQHPVPSVFKWLMWKQKEMTMKSTSKKSRGGGVQSSKQLKSDANSLNRRSMQGDIGTKSFKSSASLLK